MMQDLRFRSSRLLYSEKGGECGDDARFAFEKC